MIFSRTILLPEFLVDSCDILVVSLVRVSTRKVLVNKQIGGEVPGSSTSHSS